MATSWMVPVVRELSGFALSAATARIDSRSRRNARAEVARGSARNLARAARARGASPPHAPHGPSKAMGAS